MGPVNANSSWRLLARWLFAFAVLAALVSVIVRVGDIEEFRAVLERARPAWLLVALGLQLGTYPCAAAVFHRALAALGDAVSFRSLLALGVARLFIDQAMPAGGIGGALLAIAGLRRRGVSEAHALAALLVAIVSFYAAYVGVTLAALVLLGLRHAISPVFAVLAAILFAVAVAVPAAVVWGRRRLRRPLPEFIENRPSLALLRRALSQAPAGLAGRPSVIAGATVAQIAIFLLDAATLWAMLHAVGQPQEFSIAFVAFVTGSLAGTLSPLPLGIGAFESACIAMLRVLGVGLEPALMATLLLRGFTLWLPMPPGLWLMRRETGAR